MNTPDPKSTYDAEQRLLNYSGPDRVVSSEEKREEIRNLPPIAKFMTGIHGLDRLVDGVSPGELIAVGGKRKNGKTLLCQTLTKNFKDADINSVWFSYEVPARQFLEQMGEGISFYLPNMLANNAMSWVKERIHEAKLKHDCRIAFIDHLHFLVDMAKVRNPSLEIGAIVRSIKRMAIDLNVVIFLISHVRGVEPGVEVTEDHLRDSSFTAAEADSTWIVSRLFDKRTKEATEMCKVSVRNHRRTGVMAQSVKLIKNGKFFLETTPEYESPEPLPEEDPPGDTNGQPEEFF